MQIKQIMTKGVISVNKNSTVEEIFKIFSDNNISGVPVTENNKVIGIVSKADLMYKEKTPHVPAFMYFLGSIIYLENPKNIENDLKNFINRKAYEIMTKSVICVNEKAHVKDALGLMLEHRINRLPVVDVNEDLTGIVTRDNLLSILNV